MIILLYYLLTTKKVITFAFLCKTCTVLFKNPNKIKNYEKKVTINIITTYAITDNYVWCK